ncbi:MAG TPA: GNAT family N-acetyltransferase [Armatimonadaceae bacterium]|nr:GNAT family N-acetyltransferase [Armatimonadaceae bacterium]
MTPPPLPTPVEELRLETERLVLREYREDDWPAVLAYAADPEVLRYRASVPATEAEVRDALARLQEQRRETPRTRYEFAVALPDSDRVIGWLPLLLGRENQDAEIGWTLARAYWGRGYGTEAARAVLAFAFETLELHRVWARCQPENAASWRVMEKIGMRREAHFVRSQRVRERWVDSFYYALLAEEWWAARRESVPVPQALRV